MAQATPVPQDRDTTADTIRVTVRFDETDVKDIEALVEADEFANVSDAIRQFVGEGLDDS